MSRRRFFVPSNQIRDRVAVLPPEQVHYLRDVLRLKNGETVEVFDGEGGAFVGKAQSRAGEVRVGPLERVAGRAETGPHVVLAQALLKGEKFELILQKATELGVSEIQPLETRFCNIRLRGGKSEARLERWQRIVREAARQCGRALVPEVYAPCPLASFFERESGKSRARLFFCERAPIPWNPALVPGEDTAACIGPEGGWHDDEVNVAERAGFQVINLGPRILRAETAAIAVMALLQFRIAHSGPRINIRDP